MPKQFIDFFSTGRTLLQSTFDRVMKLVPVENIYVSTNHEYAHYVLEQLPLLPPDNVLSEPVHRNTGASVAWATYRVYRRDKNARLIVVPSDQAVFKEERFLENVNQGFNIVGEHDIILTMGVKPTRPEPGYGYIQIGEKTISDDVFSMKSFTEKPERDFARIFVDSGEFLWNSGLYLSNVTYLRQRLHEVFPAVLRRIDEALKSPSLEDELLYIEENFSSYPNVSIDSGLLEGGAEVWVMRCDFGWADLGMWHSIYENMQKGENDNVVIASNVMLEDCKNNIVKLPKDRLGIINGLEGYIVAEEGNVLLICKKEDSSALVKKYVSEVLLKQGEDFI